jgi:hypothetical protein
VRKKNNSKKGPRELSLVEHVAIELNPSLTQKGKPKKDPQRQKEQDKLPPPQVESRREPELTDLVLDLPARPGHPTFITCGRFYLTPGQQAEASCLKEDEITATAPRPAALLRDPLEDPVPSVVEDLSSLKLSSDTTLLLQEIWVIKQR